MPKLKGYLEEAPIWSSELWIMAMQVTKYYFLNQCHTASTKFILHCHMIDIDY